LIVAGIVVRANRPGDASKSCQEYYRQMKNPPAAAADWCKAGKYIPWKSTLPENASYGTLNVFTVCMGNPQNPAMLLIHGYPTSSFDFAKLAKQLSGDYYLCALDTPGYGFSDKPRNGYHYSLFDDARLVDYFIRAIGLQNFTLVTHDKGDSVGLALLQIYQSYSVKPYTINHHIITNGNIYLPLAQLSILQKMLLNPIAGPELSSLMDGLQLANGLAGSTFTPALTMDEVDALASIFDYQNGIQIEHDIIQYLNERQVNEVTWLETLKGSDIPTTLIWGERDAIAPTAVPDYVWSNYLSGQTTPASYWRIPCANHYVQDDQPELLAALIRSTVARTLLPAMPSAACQPIRVK
jgi:pimeloyl-ACP methyl ester carboxylesterase